MKSVHVNSSGERELHPDERILYSVDHLRTLNVAFFLPYLNVS